MNWMTAYTLVGLTVVLGSVAAFAASDDFPAAPYPQGYRRWTHLHSTVIGRKHVVFAARPCEKPCTGGVMHFYANDKAMEGLQAGRFAEGAAIATETLEIRRTDDATQEEGPPRGVSVMFKDSRRFQTTGGWGFGSFRSGEQTDRLDAKAKTNCFACHSSAKDRDFVFSKYEER